jgi:hypothetical protein
VVVAEEAAATQVGVVAGPAAEVAPAVVEAAPEVELAEAAAVGREEVVDQADPEEQAAAE